MGTADFGGDRHVRRPNGRRLTGADLRQGTGTKEKITEETMRHILSIPGKSLKAFGLVAAAFAGLLSAACSGADEAAEMGSDRTDDGPIIIRADVADIAGTRTTFDSDLLSRYGKWTLFYPLASSVTSGQLDAVEVQFNKQGYGTLRKAGISGPYEFTWNDLSVISDYSYQQYLFVLDNVASHNTKWREKDILEDGKVVALGVVFSKEEREKYAAGLEDEKAEEPAENDIVLGHLEYPNNSEPHAVLEFRLKHLMSRVSVELEEGKITASTPLKVWITPLAKECTAMNRAYPAQYQQGAAPLSVSQNTLLVRPLNDAGTGFADIADEEIFKEKLYLVGDETGYGTLKPVGDDGESPSRKPFYRTGRLILPPQSTHYDTSLHPKMYVQLESAPSTVYSAPLPGSLFDDESKSQVPFDRFESGKDIIIRARIEPEDPVIKLEGRVRKWEDRGEWFLSTTLGGIYDANDLKDAIALYNQITEDPIDATLKHKLDRYGSWKTDGAKGEYFTFEFYRDIDGAYPDGVEGEDYHVTSPKDFEVNLNGHTVYGRNAAKDKMGAEDYVKYRMRRRGIGTAEDLKEAIGLFNQIKENTISTEQTVLPDELERQLEKFGRWMEKRWSDKSYAKWFRFEFYDNIGDAGYPTGEEYKITSSYYFDVDLRGHTVYGEKGTEITYFPDTDYVVSGPECSIKNKMMGLTGIDSSDSFKNTLNAYTDYFDAATSKDASAAAKKKELYSYGWWMPWGRNGGLGGKDRSDVFYTMITEDFGESEDLSSAGLNKTESSYYVLYYNNYLHLDLNGHTVYGYTTNEDLATAVSEAVKP